MSNPHDAVGHETVEGIIPVGSWQDRVLELTAVLALLGLFYWGYQMSGPITVEHGGETEHGAHHEHADKHAE